MLLCMSCPLLMIDSITQLLGVKCTVLEQSWRRQSNGKQTESDFFIIIFFKPSRHKRLWPQPLPCHTKVRLIWFLSELPGGYRLVQEAKKKISRFVTLVLATKWDMIRFYSQNGTMNERVDSILSQTRCGSRIWMWTACKCKIRIPLLFGAIRGGLRAPVVLS